MRPHPALLLALFALVAVPTSAQTTSATSLTPPYIAMVRQGMEALIAGEAMVAESVLREAVALDDEQPEAHYYLGVALRAEDQLDAALEEFRRAAMLGAGTSQPIYEARGLEGAAMTLERMNGQLSEVRAAWLQALDVARAHPDILRPEIVETRIETIDQILALSEPYTKVRERQAAREEELRQQAAAQEARSRRR